MKNIFCSNSQSSSEQRVASSEGFPYMLDTIYSLLNLGWGFGVRFNPVQHLFGKGKSQTKGAGCRFNQRSRCEPVSGVAISSINEVRLLMSLLRHLRFALRSFHSLAMTTLSGAYAPKQILPNLI